MSQTHNLQRAIIEAVGRAVHEALRDQHEESSDAATAHENNNEPQPQRQPQRQTTLTQLSQSRTSSSSATRPLPSIFESSCIQYSNVGGRKRKRSSTSQSKSAKLYTKDVVCLLPSENGKDIPIPRGNSRGCLANMGLIGKISLNSAWVAKDVTREITSIFASVFDLLPGELLPFDYLGITKGTKKLSISKTSTSFQWNAPEVISLCSQGCLYIISKWEK
ncbi:uncharacterized protein LOC124459025 isoform X1 [Xenia sp. Carnegie-2017]|uniref:uncharacterized protein LOC124459025 isoform X1 n=1 Tax=Xenia sp. Carnegie-2017 TaxID=2897299 RepID=UPI001F03B052|nr:uncharacterized protein LOC124459025 isoform X1 [Xenia sp. Carnegie-2017]XP_046864547.1 uncharacterized protein LOC124459025 isoform X1 [Xenia sp. Carnegie-2017]